MRVRERGMEGGGEKDEDRERDRERGEGREGGGGRERQTESERDCWANIGMYMNANAGNILSLSGVGFAKQIELVDF